MRGAAHYEKAPASAEARIQAGESMYEQPRDDDKQNTDQRFTEVPGGFAYQKTKKSN